MAQSTLRPMRLVDILDEAFCLYRDNLMLFVGICMAGELPLRVLYILVNSPFHKQKTPFPVSLIVIITLLILLSVTRGAMAWAISRCCLYTRPTIQESFKAMLPILRTYLLTSSMVTLLETVAFALCVIPGFVMLFVCAFLPQVLVLERKTFMGAVIRSHDLLSVDLWRTSRRLFLGMVTYISAFVVVKGPLLVFYFHSKALLSWSHSTLVLFWLLSAVLEIILSPIIDTTVFLIYRDVRVRSEGLDLTLLAGSMSEAAQD